MRRQDSALRVCARRTATPDEGKIDDGHQPIAPRLMRQENDTNEPTSDLDLTSPGRGKDHLEELLPTAGNAKGGRPYGNSLK